MVLSVYRPCDVAKGMGNLLFLERHFYEERNEYEWMGSEEVVYYTRRYKYARRTVQIHLVVSGRVTAESHRILNQYSIILHGTRKRQTIKSLHPHWQDGEALTLNL